MLEIKNTFDMYTKIAHAAARVFFSMESMGDVLFLYKYSLDYFLEIWNASIKSKKIPKDSTDYGERLKIIEEVFFSNIFFYLAPGLLAKDRLVLALRLAQIRGDLDKEFTLGREELDMLIKGSLSRTSQSGASSSINSA